MNQARLLVGLYLLCNYITKVVGIDCYHCASIQGDQAECEDQFRTDITTQHFISRDCMAGYWKANFCIKLKGVKTDGTSVVIRQCATRDWGSHCGLIQLHLSDRREDIEGCLETCDFDGCNTATLPSTNSILIALTSAITFMTSMCNNR